MRILILGSGGREHALYRKIKESSKSERVFVWPGNGLVEKKDRVDAKPIEADFNALKEFIEREKIDFTVVGNETPLVNGVRDALKQKFPQHTVFGPDQNSAALEGSKAFADAFMVEAKIPHGESVVVQSLAEAKDKLQNSVFPLVIKADGLAAGKGVSIHNDVESAAQKLSEIFEKKIFGASGNRVLLQKFLHGVEASLFALCNGSEALLLPTARDYKRALTHDQGENTGGMGAYTPAHHLTNGQKKFVLQKIIQPVLEKFKYKGLLYVGLMVASEKDDGVAVVEFNVRWGDPETQSILPLLEGDLLEYLCWTDGGAADFPLLSSEGVKFIPYMRGAVVNVVISAKGYPANFKKSIPIVFPKIKDAKLHTIGAGIREENGKYFSTGGRIFSIVSYGKTKDEARENAYKYLKDFSVANSHSMPDLYWREDIAQGI
ncbi:MAG: Phosphoribosylamine--glycine ligase [Turneriella sp.]|nr:Phosphoribosylamine--glycine ligase [Turneriella sp.]